MADQPVLRVLTYNVRSLRDDPAAVARVIRAADPHLVFIQEAPRFVRWRAKCAALSRRSGLVIVTGGRPAAANLILSSLGVDVLAHRDALLSRAPGLHQRGVALAELRWRGHHFAAAGTHLDLEPAQRVRHVAEIERLLAGFCDPGLPTIVAGDTNDVPGSPTWQALGSGRTDVFGAVGPGDGPTFTARNPQRRLDAIFVAPSITPRSATVLDGPDVETGSDHRPVLAELAF